MAVITSLVAQLQAGLGGPVNQLEMTPVGGGSINQAFRLLVNGREPFFCKLNDARRFPGLFEKEKNGLELLAAQDIIRIPRVLLCQTLEDKQALVLEWMEPGYRPRRVLRPSCHGPGHDYPFRWLRPCFLRSIFLPCTTARQLPAAMGYLQPVSAAGASQFIRERVPA